MTSFFSLSFFDSSFLSRPCWQPSWSRLLGSSWIARRHPFRVCRCVYTNGAQAHSLRHVGRSDLSLGPLLRRLDEHADFKIEPTFPSPFYVDYSVGRQEFGVLAAGSISPHDGHERLSPLP